MFLTIRVKIGYYFCWFPKYIWKFVFSFTDLTWNICIEWSIELNIWIIQNINNTFNDIYLKVYSNKLNFIHNPTKYWIKPIVFLLKLSILDILYYNNDIRIWINEKYLWANEICYGFQFSRQRKFFQTYMNLSEVRRWNFRKCRIVQWRGWIIFLHVIK